MSLIDRIATYVTQGVSWDEAGDIAAKRDAMESGRAAGLDVTRLTPDQRRSYFECMRGNEETRRIIGDSDGRVSAGLCFTGIIFGPEVDRLLTTSTRETLRLMTTGFTPVASMECGATMSCVGDTSSECDVTMSCDRPLTIEARLHQLQETRAQLQARQQTERRALSSTGSAHERIPFQPGQIRQRLGDILEDRARRQTDAILQVHRDPLVRPEF